MTTTTHRRMSATERLEQLRDFVATHERPPSRRIGDPEEKSLGEWIAKHKNSNTRTGEAVRELLAGGSLAAPAVNDLEDYQKFCAKHMRAPMAATGVAREQALWEWARVQTDSDTVAAIAEARARCRVSTPGASQREKLGELAQFAKTHRRPPSPHSKDKHERDLAEWVRINVQAKSYLAREVERIYREHRADQHHAQRIAAGRLNGLVAFVAKTGRAPQLKATDEREAQLAKWAMDYCKDSGRPEVGAMAPRAAAVSTHHRRRAAAYRDFVTSHGRHPRLVTDSAAEASLARWKASDGVGITSMRSLGIEEEGDCVRHPAESETFQRSVVAHCASQSETLGQVAAIWMELVSAGAPLSGAITSICTELPDLSPAQVRRRIHRIRALAVDLLESQLDITPADI